MCCGTATGGHKVDGQPPVEGEAVPDVIMCNKKTSPEDFTGEEPDKDGNPVEAKFPGSGFTCLSPGPAPPAPDAIGTACKTKADDCGDAKTMCCGTGSNGHEVVAGTPPT